MLLTIHNLPTRSSYGDVKELIIAKCGLKDCILDNMQNEGSGMRVTVGVGEEEDAAILVRKINGLYFRGQQLYVQDKRQKKDSEQPYRTALQSQAQQPHQGYDYTTQMQSMGMYNFAMFQPQSIGMETVQNSYVAYGGPQAQQQPLVAQLGQFGEFRQQPFLAAPEPIDVFARRSMSPGRNRRDIGNTWDTSRRSRGERDEPPPQHDYEDSRGFINERPDRSRGFDMPQDRFEKHAPRQQDTRDEHAPFASNINRGGHYGNTRGGHSPRGHELRNENYRNSRGGHTPNANESHRGNYGNKRGGIAPIARESRARGGHALGVRTGNYGNMRGGDEPGVHEPRGGNYSNMRGGDAPHLQEPRGGNFGSTRGLDAPDVHEPRGGIYGNTRGGNAPGLHEHRGGNYGNTRSDNAPGLQEPRGGNYGNMRGGDAPGVHEPRGGNYGNMRGGDAPGVHEPRGGNYGNMRGGDAPGVHEPRGGNYGNMRGDDSPGVHEPRGGNYGNTRGGIAPRARESRARGGHASIAHLSRAGEYGNTRGGHAPSAQESRAGRYNSTRGEPDRDELSRYVNPNKRRWDEPDHYERKPAREDPWHKPESSQRPQPRDEPRPKRFAANPAKPGPDARPVHVQKPGIDPAAFSYKLFRTSIVKGTGKLMYEVANALNVVHELAGPNPVKTALRKYLTSRVTDIVGDQILSPEEILARYRAKYPPSDDAVLYNDISINIAEKAATAKQAPGVPAASKKLKGPANKKLPTIPPGKIPSYPQADKKIHKEQKQQNKKDMKTMDAYEVNETFQKAMDEEVEQIAPVLEKEFTNASDKAAQLIVDNNDKKEFVSKCKKLIVHHLSRRITNSGTKMVRIHGAPKLPRRPELEDFLSQYDCLSLKKSVKAPVFLASFDSYETIDELVSLDPVEIGGVFVTFKHMHIGPMKPKIDQKQAKVLRRKYVDSLVEESKVNLLDKSWQTLDEEEKKDKAEKRPKSENSGATESDDVIFVGGNKGGITVDITGEDNLAEQDKEASTEITEENDFLHGDFKVIDEVRESDNDETANEANIEDKENDGYEIADDGWDATGEDWRDVVNDANDKTGEGDINGDEIDNNEEIHDDDDEADEEIGELNAEDVDLDDINEDDLEDY